MKRIEDLSPIEYLRMLVNEGMDCEHPPRYRKAIPGESPLMQALREDPQSWECEVCGTAQLPGQLFGISPVTE